ncbi:MAG: metal ABC transporter permease [Bacteroidales bacterium]|nr:metal ABC transporter permease [Bacteroidales bacterium]
MDFFIDLFTDYTTRTIGIGTAILGIVSGVLGSYAVLRQQSLLGDAISHATLPGIAIAFLIIGTKSTAFFFLGAAVAGWAGTMWIRGIVQNTRIKSDSALGLVLSVFFGFGMVLLTFIQKMPNANQAGLETFLFGQAATLIHTDVILMAIIGAFSLFAVILLWKEFKILTFDPQYAATLGFNTKLLDIILIFIIVLAIVLGLQAVGVVLMSAMLLAPAAAARQWTDSLSIMILLAALFGALAGLTGTAISSAAMNLSTGPVIVLVSIAFVFISFMFAPNRGLLFREIRKQANKKEMRMNHVLENMYWIALGHENLQHPHSNAILNKTLGYSKKCMRELRDKHLIELNEDYDWNLTEKGIKRAKEVYTDNNKNEQQ